MHLRSHSYFGLDKWDSLRHHGLPSIHELDTNARQNCRPDFPFRTSSGGIPSSE